MNKKFRNLFLVHLQKARISHNSFCQYISNRLLLGQKVWVINFLNDFLTSYTFILFARYALGVQTGADPGYEKYVRGGANGRQKVWRPPWDPQWVIQGKALMGAQVAKPPEAPGFNRFVSKVRLLRLFSRDYNVKMIKLKTLKGLI